MQSRKLTEAEARKIIADSLQVTPEELDARAEDLWDSLGYVNILVAFDKAFDGKVANIKEMSEATSVSAIIQILRKNGLVS